VRDFLLFVSACPLAPASHSAAPVPEISRFFGIVIGMFYAEHGVPHFHAVYGSDTASIGIVGARILEGGLPPRAMRLVLEWERLHERELLENWERPGEANRSKPSPR
jgi:hypothetical protein